MKNVNSIQSMFVELEEETKKAFSELRPEDVKVSRLLSKMEMKLIENILSHKYKAWIGDRRMRYHPMSIMKSIILKELLCISSYPNLIEHLHNYSDEAEDLGYDGMDLPVVQTFSAIRKEKMDENMFKLLDFVADKIRQIAREEGKLMDIDFVNKKEGIYKMSTRTIERYKSREGNRIVRLLRKEIFPILDLPLKCKARYGKDNFLDLLAYVAYRNMYTNGGYRMMINGEEKFKGRVPHARTLLGYLAEMEDKEIIDMFKAAFDRIVKIAKSRGLLKDEVDLAMDYTDWLYYGDKSDPMVVGGEYKNGTDRRFKYVTIKIAERYGDFTLMAFPIGVFTNHREAVKKLITYAKDKVKPRYFYVDRGFYSAKYISLFEETGIRYLMPGVKNERILRMMERHPPNSVVDTNLKSSDGKYEVRTKIAIKKDEEGKVACFATNLPKLMLYTSDLFKLYKKRWNIETAYRVKKQEFRPGTTSKNYRIRMFYFLFSCLLYNLWVITNAMLSDYLFGEQVGYRLIMAKMFMKRFYEAYRDYVP